MKSRPLIIVLAASFFICAAALACLSLVGGVTTIARTILGRAPALDVFITEEPTSTPVVIRQATTMPTPVYEQADIGKNNSPDVFQTPGTHSLPVGESPVLTETLRILQEAHVPINDPLSLAWRLQGKNIISAVVNDPLAPYSAGAQKSFWVLDSETSQPFKVDATLHSVTDHAYFWIEDGIRFNPSDLEVLATSFENQIYPTNREFFGSEWSPGVDGDPHLYILYASGVGGIIAGYFSPRDEYPPEASEYSNAHEMFLLNADKVELDSDFAHGVLAHEFQHMIHWYRDRNEEIWMNEGFSDVAMLLNNYGVGGVDYAYTADPDLQLNYWPDSDQTTLPHYGASFLFLTYFLDRFGELTTQALVAEPTNGLDSIDVVLEREAITDNLTGEAIGADDVFADWVVASYLHNKDVEDGRFTYHNYPSAPQPVETEVIHTCPTEQITRDVSQYGVDYIRIRCSGEYTINFQGSVQVNLVPIDPHSGAYAFWSNKGDSSDMSLTRHFDFSEHNGPLTLTYWTWYDLEKDYDYLYLLASLDGETWDILATPTGTQSDPTGNSYGWAYNGKSTFSTSNDNDKNPEWVQESINVSQFAGQDVYLRFEYITDGAVNGEGFLLDDVAIPEVGYASDFEQDDGGWQGQGFVRIHNRLPQTFRLSLISLGRGTSVEQFVLEGDNSLSIPIQIGGDIDEAILVVSGTTRFTHQKAAYQFSIEYR